MHILEWKLFNFERNFTELCSLGSNWQNSSIGSDNGLAPNRRQAIICTNVYPVHWRMYAAIGGDELTHSFHNDQIWQAKLELENIKKHIFLKRKLKWSSFADVLCRLRIYLLHHFWIYASLWPYSVQWVNENEKKKLAMKKSIRCINQYFILVNEANLVSRNVPLRPHQTV